MKKVLLTAAVAALALGVADTAQAFGVGGVRAGARVGPAGAGVGRAAGGVHVGPVGGVHAGGARGGTYVGPRGTTVQGGQVGGVHAGPLGGVQAGGAQGVRVTTPGGRTYTSGERGGVGVGPAGGVRMGGSAGAVASGPFGATAVGGRAGFGVGPVGGVGGGYTVGHRTAYVSPVHLGSWGTTVRTGFNYRCFTPTWYSAHPVAWTTNRWVAGNVWTPVTFPAVATYVGINAQPAYYDYGSTVVIESEQVYYNGEPVATAADYAQQAAGIADVGRTARPPETDAWQPLGVFGLMQGDEQQAQRIFQLAVNKAGIIRGNYYDAVADNTLPVYGSVEQRTQRAAWSIGDKKDVVFETGLYNLTQEQTTLLVHFGKDRTQQMILVRLQESADGQPQPQP